MSTDESRDGHDALLERIALASMRVDLELLSGKARDDARAELARSSSEFDGARLVDICLQDPQASAGPLTVERAMLALRGRLLGLETAAGAPRRARRRSGGKRFLAWLLIKLMFWPILIVLTAAILVLVKRQWPEADVYVWGGKAMDFLGLR